MKKVLVLMFAICMTAMSANAIEPDKNLQSAKPQEIQRTREMVSAQRNAAFERKLNLTEVQKLKARQIRQKGHEALRPVLEEIKNKKQEAEMVRRSRIAVQMQEEKLSAIDADLKVLEKKAQEIRKQNMKEFESILTREQKKALKQMKKEGRDRYRKSHPVPLMRNASHHVETK